MRIAHISDCYLPRLGGIEAQVHGLARRQLAAGHEVTVLTATAGPHGERHGGDRSGRRRPRASPGHPAAVGLPVNPFAPKDVRSILLAGRYDAVHVHAGVVSPFAYDAIKVVLDLGRPMVVTWHCVLGRSEPLGQVWERLRDWSSRPIAFTAVSDVAAEPLRRILGSRRVSRCSQRRRCAGLAGAPIRHGHEVRLVSAMRLARANVRSLCCAWSRGLDRDAGRRPGCSCRSSGPARSGPSCGPSPTTRNDRLGRPARSARPRRAGGDLPPHRHLSGTVADGVVRHRRHRGPGRGAADHRALRQRHPGVRRARRRGTAGRRRRGDGRRHRRGWSPIRSAATDLRRTTRLIRRSRTGTTSLARADEEYARAARIVERGHERATGAAAATRGVRDGRVGRGGSC